MLPNAKGFPTHFRVFAVVVVLLIGANLAFSLGLPIFWPIAAWSVALAIRYFIASALVLDDDWVQEKTVDLHSRSYDFGHIDDIRDRVDARDHSVIHHEERAPAENAAPDAPKPKDKAT